MVIRRINVWPSNFWSSKSGHCWTSLVITEPLDIVEAVERHHSSSSNSSSIFWGVLYSIAEFERLSLYFRLLIFHWMEFHHSNPLALFQFVNGPFSFGHSVADSLVGTECMWINIRISGKLSPVAHWVIHLSYPLADNWPLANPTGNCQAISLSFSLTSRVIIGGHSSSIQNLVEAVAF